MLGLPKRLAPAEDLAKRVTTGKSVLALAGAVTVAEAGTNVTFTIVRSGATNTAVAVGVAGLFIETHPDPDKAPSDGPNMVPLKDFEGLMRNLKALDKVVKGQLSS